MRRESADAARAARRRLELLGKELARAGLAPEPPEPPEPPKLAGLPDRVAAPDAGRHSRGRAAPRRERLLAALSERLPETLQGRIRLSTSHLALLAVTIGIALAVVGWFTVRSTPHAEAVPVAHTSPLAAARSADAATTVSAAPTTSRAPAVSVAPRVSSSVVVDVAGKVAHPGVASLPAGARVIDAIRHAGGAKPGVDLSTLNLARVLVDGEQVVVGITPRSAASGRGSTAPDTAGHGAANAKVNLNSASLDQLEELPGVGPVTAQKILDWRTAHGSFASLDDLLDVAGIGPKTLADLSPHATW